MITSPFDGLHKNLGANFSSYCGFHLPADYGNIAGECGAVYQGCAAFDMSAFARISISGDDAQILVHNLFCSRTDGLETGRWIWAVVTDVCGNLLDIVRLCRINNSWLILASPPARAKILERAKACAAQSGLGSVKIIDNTEKTGMLGLYGPAAMNAFSRIVPLEIPELEPGACYGLSLFMMPISIIRGSFLGADGIELIAPSAACKLAASALEKYHKKENITPAGMEALEIALTESSMPTVVTEQQLPQRLAPAAYGLSPLLDIKKYCCQAPHTHMRQLVGLKIQGQAHNHKDLKIQYNGIEIGWTDRIVFSHKLGGTFALAMIDTEMCDLSEELQVVGSNFTMPAEIINLPLDAALATKICRQ